MKSFVRRTLTYGGDLEDSGRENCLQFLRIADCRRYYLIILLIHFRNVNIALLIFKHLRVWEAVGSTCAGRGLRRNQYFGRC